MFCLFRVWILRVGWVQMTKVLCPIEAVHRGNTWRIVCGLMTLALSENPQKQVDWKSPDVGRYDLDSLLGKTDALTQQPHPLSKLYKCNNCLWRSLAFQSDGVSLTTLAPCREASQSRMWDCYLDGNPSCEGACQLDWQCYSPGKIQI